MKYFYDDGGRLAAGFRGDADDCVTRAVAIATQQPYGTVYERMAAGNASERVSAKHKTRGKRTARNGIRTQSKWFKDYMAALGWKWVPTMTIGSGCKVHLREGELPTGRLIVRVSKHVVAVIDGVIHDNHDPQRERGRCVYGYWQKT